jgi:nitrate/nitrite transporter NarK
MSELDTARLTSAGAYLRPVAAILTGWIVDRFVPSRVILLIFFFLLFGYISLAWTTPEKMSELFIIGNLMFTALAVFGVRGVYFALLEESKISQRMTGTAVGLISAIGFTPDIFFASLAGRILDSAPGTQGYLLFFTFLTGIAAIGIISTVFLLQQSAGKPSATGL